MGMPKFCSMVLATRPGPPEKAALILSCRPMSAIGMSRSRGIDSSETLRGPGSTWNTRARLITPSRRRFRLARSWVARMRKAREVVSSISREATMPPELALCAVLPASGGQHPADEQSDDHDRGDEDRQIDRLLVAIATSSVEAHGSALDPARRSLQPLLADQLLDVDVLEGDHAHLVDEPRRTVHVPDPRVVQGEVEVGVAVLIAHLQVDLVRKVEATFRLDGVLEHAQHVAILLIELQLHLRLVPFEVLGAHRPSCRTWSSAVTRGSAAQGAATPANE